MAKPTWMLPKTERSSQSSLTFFLTCATRAHVFMTALRTCTWWTSSLTCVVFWRTILPSDRESATSAKTVGIIAGKFGSVIVLCATVNVFSRFVFVENTTPRRLNTINKNINTSKISKTPLKTPIRMLDIASCTTATRPTWQTKPTEAM